MTKIDLLFIGELESMPTVRLDHEYSRGILNKNMNIEMTDKSLKFSIIFGEIAAGVTRGDNLDLRGVLV